jgi:hypothetical protein
MVCPIGASIKLFLFVSELLNSLSLIVAPGGWPGATDEQKEQIRLGLKYTAWGSKIFETCVFKTGMAGVAGMSALSIH